MLNRYKKTFRRVGLILLFGFIFFNNSGFAEHLKNNYNSPESKQDEKASYDLIKRILPG